MKAAIVNGSGQVPVYAEFSEPVTGEGEVMVSVSASAMSQVTKSRASGRHYSSSGQFPFVAGIDGVGRLEDGRRVYFVLPRAPFGGMAERVALPLAQCVSLPDDIDDVTAAAIANPGMSSWAAYVERARLEPGETVLVNGATGTAGQLAVQIAKHLGAGKVIATGRSAQALDEVKALGADEVIVLNDDLDNVERLFKQHFAHRVDVVIDYLWGSSAERLLIAAAKAAPEAAPIRFVQIGSISDDTIALPSAVLRSSAITLMGSGIGSIAPDRFIAAIAGLMAAVEPAGLRIATKPLPLDQVEQAWPFDDSRRRTVFTL